MPFDWAWWGSSVVTAVIGSAVAVIALIKWVPEKIVGHFLDRRINDHRHDQAAQIERLRADLAHLGDRGLRSNEREYQAMVAIWDAFVDAFYAARGVIGSFITFPDFPRTPDEDRLAFIEQFKFEQRTIDRIMAAADRQKAFLSAEKWQAISQGNRSIHKLRDTLRRQALSLSENLFQQLEAAIEQLQYTVSTREIELETGSPLEGDRGRDLIGPKGDDLLRDVRAAIRAPVFQQRRGP